MKKIFCLIFGHIGHRVDLKHYKKCKWCNKRLDNYQCGKFWVSRI